MALTVKPIDGASGLGTWIWIKEPDKFYIVRVRQSATMIPANAFAEAIIYLFLASFNGGISSRSFAHVMWCTHCVIFAPEIGGVIYKFQKHVKFHNFRDLPTNT